MLYINLVWLILVLFCCVTIAFASLSHAPWVPSRKKDFRRIIRLANIKKGDYFYELGCGDGRICSFIAKDTGCRSVGIELALPFYLLCLARKFFNTDLDLKFIFNNFYWVDLGRADVVYFFAAGEEFITEKFKNKLKKDLKKGTRIVSYTFPISGWEVEKISKPKKNDIGIYLYKM
jgi:SAM-dependent methyltransferase